MKLGRAFIRCESGNKLEENKNIYLHNLGICSIILTYVIFYIKNLYTNRFTGRFEPENSSKYASYLLSVRTYRQKY